MTSCFVHRVAPNGSSSVARGGSVGRKVYCAECWEKMEVKRLASVVRCADCGDRFPLSKTAPFPVARRTLGAIGSSARGEDIVDVCFLCAPGWEPRRAEEAARRGLANDPARWNEEDAAADAAAAELRAMPRADRLRLLDATLGSRTTTTGAKKKRNEKTGDDEGDEDGEDEDGAEAALDRRLRDAPDLYPWQVGHPAQAKIRENRSSDRGIDAPPATIGAAAVEGVARAQDESWAVAGTDIVARGAPGARTQMLPIDRFKADVAEMLRPLRRRRLCRTGDAAGHRAQRRGGGDTRDEGGGREGSRDVRAIADGTPRFRARRRRRETVPRDGRGSRVDRRARRDGRRALKRHRTRQ